MDTDNYKDFAPTEHDLGLPNVQTPHAGGDARATMWDGVPARQIVENGLEMSKLQAWVRKEMKFALQGQPNVFLSPPPEMILFYLRVTP